MTTPRDIRRDLDAVDDSAEADEVPPMLISPLTDPVPGDRPPWYYHAESDTIYATEEVDPDEHFTMELEAAIIESSVWYDPARFPDDEVRK